MVHTAVTRWCTSWPGNCQSVGIEQTAESLFRPPIVDDKEDIGYWRGALVSLETCICAVLISFVAWYVLVVLLLFSLAKSLAGGWIVMGGS